LIGNILFERVAVINDGDGIKVNKVVTAGMVYYG